MTEPELLTRQKTTLRTFWHIENIRAQAQANAERERDRRISEANAAYEQVSRQSAELLRQIEAEGSAAQEILNRVRLGDYLRSTPLTITVSDLVLRDPLAELTSALNQARNIKNHLQARASELEQVRLFRSKLIRFGVVLAIVVGLALLALIMGSLLIYAYVNR